MHTPERRHARPLETIQMREQLNDAQRGVLRLLEHFGWELRFVLAGALRILDRLQSLDHDVAAGRPKLGWRDAPALLAKAAVLTRRQAARG